MRGWMLSGAVLACVAACARPRVEHLARPRADGPTPVEEARRNEYQLLLEGLSAYRGLDPRQRAASTPANMYEALPPIPPVLPPVRPRLRGDALVLADLALDRGDALDAAAQLRAWIDGRDSATTGYAHVQLARAYVALGQIDHAVAALSVAARAPDTEWYALVQLAQLRLPTLGPLAVATQLTRMVPARADDIENFIIALAPPGEAAELLMRKVERAPTSPFACRYAIAAVARGVHRVPAGVSGDCRLEIARAIHIELGEPWLDERNPTRRLLEANRVAWATSLSSSEANLPATWLGLAERYAHAAETATTVDDRELGSRSAATALINVLRVAYLGRQLTEDDRLRFDATLSTLELVDRRRISKLIRRSPTYREVR